MKTKSCFPTTTSKTFAHGGNVVWFVLLTTILLTTPAASSNLGPGISLTIDPGTGGSPPDGGSYFAMEISRGIFTFTKLAPGADGGIILGQAQPHPSFAEQLNGSPGGIDAVWSFFSNLGNTFTIGSGVEPLALSDGSPALSFRNWGIFWNDKEILLGAGLDRIPGNDDDLVPIVPSTIGLDPFVDNSFVEHSDGTYDLVYNAVVPIDPPSGFEGVHYTVFLTGSVVPEPASLWLVGAPLAALIIRRRNKGPELAAAQHCLR